MRVDFGWMGSSIALSLGYMGMSLSPPGGFGAVGKGGCVGNIPDRNRKGVRFIYQHQI